MIVGGCPADRSRAALPHEQHASAAVVAIDAALLPFSRDDPFVSPTPRILRIDDIEAAFPNHQAGATRLVLTQSTYSLQRWLDRLNAADRIVATGDWAALASAAPEALEGRGPWRQFAIVDLDAGTDARAQPSEVLDLNMLPAGGIERILMRAYHSPSSAERLELCREAVSAAPESATAALALASAYREIQDMTSAREALDAALMLAPDWEAAHYEDGKFWLGVEDMDRARAAFQRACNLMPTFSASFSNLGATLGELDQPEAALAAFRNALEADPDSFMILNNIGVVMRDLGRLGESEAALRRVVGLAPQFVFGHYNLGHTLLLSRQYAAALEAYTEGQRRDPQKNRRQGCRLAVVRFANGDAAGAERDLWQFADQAPPDEREDLLLEAYEVAHAVMADQPALATHREFLGRLEAALTRQP